MLPSAQVSVERAIGLGYQRWDIENHGFKELVEGWHADHVWKHDTAAIECFLLMTFLAFILFHAFLYLNVKPSLRQGKSKDSWTRVMAAEIRPGLHPIRTVTVIRAARPWTRSTCQTPAFFPAPAGSRGVPVSSLLASLKA